MWKRFHAAAALLALAPACLAVPEDAQPLSAMARMPVKEVTVFKDGHVLVLHEGRMPMTGAGQVAMDYLPAPVLGTFWVYTSDKGSKVTSVTSRQRRVIVERTCISQQELIEANIGAEVAVIETGVNGDKPYPATIVGIPSRNAAELEANDPPYAPARLPERAQSVLLKTAEGTSLVPFDRIRSLTFKAEPRRKVQQEEFRNLLTATVRGEGAAPAAAAMGMMYVQKGIRWIPSYKVTLDGKGNAAIKLQATLINELIDVDDVTVNLVIGVPTFAFKDTVDPMSLQQQMAQLGQYFNADARTGQAFSNAIMSQARFSEQPVGGMGGGAGLPAEPEVGGQSKAEDLFVFTLKHVSLRKGARMIVPVAEFALKYRDVYTLDVPFAPPPEVRASSGRERDPEIAKLLGGLKVQHQVRLTNKSAYPLTTAPALICLDDRVLGQNLMTYTAIGGDVDLTVTQAVDVRAKRSDKETGRKPDAYRWSGNSYGQVDMAGSIELTNFLDEAVDVEVTRSVLGHTDTVGADGKAEMANSFEDSGRSEFPTWWGYYGWPGWWHNVNGMGRFTWKVKVAPKKPVVLPYTWHYYWQ